MGYVGHQRESLTVQPLPLPASSELAAGRLCTIFTHGSARSWYYVPMTKTLTKKAAGEQARKILSHGYFAASYSVAYVYLEGERVELYGSMGRLPKHAEMVRQLTQAILDRDFNARYDAEQAEARS